MLRKIRILLAAVFFIGITLLFLDFTGTAHAWLRWMAKIQFLPAVLALDFVIVSALILLTIIFGRVYCSIICPLGVMQDIISWAREKSDRKNRFRFKWKPAKNLLRYTVLAVFITGMILGAHSIAVLIAPYSAYGRIAADLLAPVYRIGNNILAWLAERAGSYAFYSTEVWVKSVSGLVIAIVTFITIFVLAWKSGRTWCNTICPVGTVLGFLSRFSLFAPMIDEDKCRQCGLCEKRCKSSCISMKGHKIDYSRCVDCLDCIDVCKEGAIKYTLRRSGIKSSKASSPDKHSRTAADKGRRAFITSAVMATAAAAAKAQEMKVDGGLAAISHAEIPERQTPLVPPGSISLKNISDHCTSCQLCISACPNGVLHPSSSLERLMQPEMSYERGYCRPECTVCSDICPAGAIVSIGKEEKSSIQIGHAVVNLNNCVVNTDNVSCGNCARHCPAGAISMVLKDPDNPESLSVPAVNEERCIGCGACENLCPARPFTAIHVEGHEVHKYI